MNKLNISRAARTRRRTVSLVLSGGVTRAEAARRAGVHRSTAGRWVAQARRAPGNYTGRCAPRTRRTSELDSGTVQRILEIRARTGRCAPVVHELLGREGVQLSPSAVARTLARSGSTSARYRWPRGAKGVASPSLPSRPGATVQVDTIEILGRRQFVFTVIDVVSRWAYAEVHALRRQTDAISTVLAAQEAAPFQFQIVQTDNGPEFGRLFDHVIDRGGVQVRHTRRGTPSENAYVERFNRTLLDECIRRHRGDDLPGAVRGYLAYYNAERPHMALGLRSPADALAGFGIRR